MKKTEFERKIKELSHKGLLSKKKLAALSNADKTELLHYIVGRRVALIKDLINPETDLSWLHSMGYLYEARNEHFEFLCTSEQLPAFKSITVKVHQP